MRRFRNRQPDAMEQSPGGAVRPGSAPVLTPRELHELLVVAYSASDAGQRLVARRYFDLIGDQARRTDLDIAMMGDIAVALLRGGMLAEQDAGYPTAAIRYGEAAEMFGRLATALDRADNRDAASTAAEYARAAQGLSGRARGGQRSARSSLDALVEADRRLQRDAAMEFARSLGRI